MTTKKSYETLKQELDAIVASLQSGEVAVDEAIKLHTAGEKIIAQLEAQLQSLENTVTTVATSKGDE